MPSHIFVLTILLVGLTCVQSQCLLIKSIDRNGNDIELKLKYETLGLKIISTATFTNISSVIRINHLVQQSYTYAITDENVQLYINLDSRDMAVSVVLSNVLENGIVPAIDASWTPLLTMTYMTLNNVTILSCNVPILPPVPTGMNIDRIFGLLVVIIVAVGLTCVLCMIGINLCIDFREKLKKQDYMKFVQEDSVELQTKYVTKQF